MYNNILVIIKYIYGLLKDESCQFKEYINDMVLKAVLKKYNSNPCQLYRLNKIGGNMSKFMQMPLWLLYMNHIYWVNFNSSIDNTQLNK